MKKCVILLVLHCFTAPVLGQKSPLELFDPLVTKTWEAEGKWGDGSDFKQKIKFAYELDSTLVIVRSIGFIDQEQTRLGPRNYGIRQFDKKSEQIKFWEFDVFGGLTEGIVFSEGKHIFYTYAYQGAQITEMWEYVDDGTYNFKVGEYNDGVWKQTYLNTQFKEVEGE